METEGLDFGAALESLAERYRVHAGARDRGPARRGSAAAPGAAARAAGAHRRVLRARAVGGARGRGRARVPRRRAGLRRTRCAPSGSASRRTRGTAWSTARAAPATATRSCSPPGSRPRTRRGAADRSLPRARHVPADRRARARARLRRARDERRASKPKYLNTSDGELFHKGRIVYGADMARAAAAKAGRVVLVEGYTDVIALHQAGVPEAVAQMGTALTDAQVDAIARLAPKALFCQDPDRAGQESVGEGHRRAALAQRRAPSHARGRVPDRSAARRPGPRRRRPAVRRRSDALAARARDRRSSASRSSARWSSGLSADDILDAVVPSSAHCPRTRCGRARAARRRPPGAWPECDQCRVADTGAAREPTLRRRWRMEASAAAAGGPAHLGSTSCGGSVRLRGLRRRSEAERHARPVP